MLQRRAHRRPRAIDECRHSRQETARLAVPRDRRAAHRLDATRRSRRCSSCRSTTSCTRRSGCTGSISIRTPCRSRRCCRSRPAAAPRTAPTARRASRFETGVDSHDLMPLDDGARGGARARRTPARRASAWARRTAGRRTRSSSRSSRWSRRSRRSGSRPARRSACCAPGQARALAERRPRLLQPQPRHRRPEFYEQDHHAREPMPIGSRRSSACARPASRSAAAASSAWARRARDRAGLLHTLATLDAAARERADQRARAGPGHAARRRARRSIRSSSCACIAVARILMPRSHVRLSAGRSDFSDELQALCFFAGANSIFYGEKLLTTGNPGHGGRSAACSSGSAWPGARSGSARAALRAAACRACVAVTP